MTPLNICCTSFDWLSAVGVPAEHRTDSLSAAYTNATEKRDLTQSYEALCQHDSMKPNANNLGASHENGVVETAHGSLKHRIDQAIKLWGSAYFASLQSYRDFLDKIVAKLNKRCKAALAEEQSQSSHFLVIVLWITRRMHFQVPAL